MINLMSKKNSQTWIAASLAGLAIAGCGGRDPHFDILGKSQSLVSAPVNNKVDILWVIRNAGLMGPIQTNLANSINSFMSSFVTKGFDYQIAVLTTDTRAVDPVHPNDPNFSGQDSCIVGTPQIILPTTPNPVNALATNSNVGFLGSTNSHQLDVLSTALAAPRLTGCNNGFMRPGAYLAVIELSDTDDDTATLPAATAAFLDSVKPAQSNGNGAALAAYSVSAFVVENASDKAQCDAIGDATFHTHGISYSEIGTKLMSLASSTGGVVSNICAADFSAGLLSVATRILEQSTAVWLASVPNVSTIQVYENTGFIPQDAANGWTFDASKNSVIFHGNAIPASNTVITVNYTPTDIVR
ncbi:MAG: hypothetical protein HY075_09075 [Deltaproteobacteria bacterium]|nr:hypothetical protein [Deltaproteobacteria bacterium]